MKSMRSDLNAQGEMLLMIIILTVYKKVEVTATYPHTANFQLFPENASHHCTEESTIISNWHLKNMDNKRTY